MWNELIWFKIRINVGIYGYDEGGLDSMNYNLAPASTELISTVSVIRGLKKWKN
jgi:hypothetical protein